MRLKKNKKTEKDVYLFPLLPELGSAGPEKSKNCLFNNQEMSVEAYALKKIMFSLFRRHSMNLWRQRCLDIEKDEMNTMV